MSPIAFIVFFICVGGLNGQLNQPPHCTQITKRTDYEGKFRYDYPLLSIPSGLREVYQKLYCINPPEVQSATTTVCDWAAPPQVQYSLGDDYVHVVRQDPSGRFLGDATIKTNQICAHEISNQGSVYSPEVSYSINDAAFK